MNSLAFSSLELHPDLLSNLDTLGYRHPTDIQAQSLPPILAGKDVIAQGKTGSGKTAAFGLGALQTLDPKNFQVQALVLCPTRELADQVAEEIRRLARQLSNIKVLTLCGGQSIGAQLSSLQQGAHIVVGTPGRIEEHLRKQTLSLEALKILVLDEADRMLDMGFQPSIDAIMEQVPSPRQTLLFSATFPKQIEQIS
ncbi:MAG: DEAD/DEAH box helicase, partial [Hydrogenovibrio sp.]|nr:DEAD/DEAH box helicase [Hydrogenovibrio sp.]